MASSNVIFRGPVGCKPLKAEGVVAGAYQPGLLVTTDGTTLTAATTAEGRPLILTNRDWYQADETADWDAAYTSGDSAVAYRPRPEETYQVRFDAGTYARGDALTISADARMAAAAAGDIACAVYDQAGATLVDGDLADATWISSYTVPTP